MRDFIFKDPWQELRLPVTPPSFTIDGGVKIQTVEIHGAGDIIFGTNGTLATMEICSFFPAKDYFFSYNTGEDPYNYVNWFLIRSYNKTECRFMVSGTPVNIPVLIENIRYSEQDGTGDVYYSLTVRQTREINISFDEFPAAAGDTSAARADEELQNQTEAERYTVKSGDCLSVICRRKYGNSNLWPKLQKYNNLKSDVIITGAVLLLPPLSVLEGMG